MILSKFTQKQTRSLSRAAICFAMAVCLSIPIFSASAQIQIPNIPGVNEAIVNSFSAFKSTHIGWAESNPIQNVVSFTLSSNNREQEVYYSSGYLSYNPSIPIEGPAGFAPAQEGISGVAHRYLNKVEWKDYMICGSDPSDSECYPFNPLMDGDVTVAITKNQMVRLQIAGETIWFTPEYVDGVLYGFANGIYTITFKNKWKHPSR